MKIGIISDLHLGDPDCRLIESGATTGTYTELKTVIQNFAGSKGLDYLVLNGDVLDFSINSFEASCIAAAPFFQAIKNDNLTRYIVYIAGNHDKHIWDAVEWETNIIRKMKKHEVPRKFRRTQPGKIEYSTGKINLNGVSYIPKTKKYGSLFLEGLFEKNKTLPIMIVYPNLYIKTPSVTYLVTHGHMMELAWVLLSELFAGEPELAGKIGIAELEEYNVPITSMICTGVGQGGAVSRLFYRIASEAKNHKTTRMRKLLDNVVPKLDALIKLPWYAELLDDALLAAVRKAAIYIAEDIQPARNDEEHYIRESVRRLLLTFYAASCTQAKDLGLSTPERIIFGHTHEAIPANHPEEVAGISQLKGAPLFLYNTGGWLKSSGKGGEIFFFHEDGALSSRNI